MFSPAFYLSPWLYAISILIISIILTLIPLVKAMLQKVEPDKATPWFNDAIQLADQQERVIANFDRIKGTLVYWKNQAYAYSKLEDARLFWSILSSVLLPILVQVYDKSLLANIFFTTLTVWTGILVTFSYTLKAEQKYQGFRAIESDYYDISRELLDFTKKEPQELEAQVENYFKTVEKIREMARDVETGRPVSTKRILS